MTSQAAPKREGRLTGKAKNNLVALGSAAVFTVYGAGFMRTKAAAARFANATDGRRPPLPGPRTGAVRPNIAEGPAAASSNTSVTARVVGESKAPVVAPQHSPTAPARASALAIHSESAGKRAVAPAAPSQTSNAAPSAATSIDPASSPMASAPQQAASTVPPAAALIQMPTPASPAPPPAAATRDSAGMSSNNSNGSNAATDSTAVKPLKDGTFTGWGTSRHGDIQATVMVKNGKIFFAAISECMTQYSCSWISQLPPQVVARQSAEVDYVSGATQSTIAFYRAVIEAMSKAK
jgi:uncharacterized protein with FMN-binding domain